MRDMPGAGEDPILLARRRESVQGIEWSPDGRWLLFTSRDSDGPLSTTAARRVDSLDNRFDGTSDTAGRAHLNHGVDPFEHAVELRRMSPLSYVRDIRTPLLIIHSENDLRCPVEQADKLFSAMRQLNKEVEYWRFPSEGHELSRSGTPRHRIQRAEIITGWFARWLMPSAESLTGHGDDVS